MDTMSLAAGALPDATTWIRMDHTHVLSAFHKYAQTKAPSRRGAIAEGICLALEIHASLEEEIFYPALQQVMAGDEVMQRALPQHDEMKRLIAELRGLDPESPRHESGMLALMRDVMHHVADEETVLLPAAERLLPDRLGELGARMTKRRVELAAPHARQLAASTLQALPSGALVAAGAMLIVGLMLGRATR